MAEVNMPNKKSLDNLDTAPVVTDTTRVKKKGLKKWKEVFIAVNREEFESAFTEHLLYPACHELAIRLAHGAIDILLNGASHPTAYYQTPNDRTPYHRISNGVSPVRNQLPIGKTGAGYALDEVGFPSYDSAMRVLNLLNDAIIENDVIDVYHFYIWSEQNPDFTDQSYGWDQPFPPSLKPILRRDGQYFLPLPKPKMIAQR